eukprot:43912_1
MAASVNNSSNSKLTLLLQSHVSDVDENEFELTDNEDWGEDPQTIYNKYVEQFGYGPKQANHLIAFAKKTGKSIKYVAARKIIVENSSNTIKSKPKIPKTKPSPPKPKPNPPTSTYNPPNAINDDKKLDQKPSPSKPPSDAKQNDIDDQKYDDNINNNNNNNYERIKIIKSNINDIKSKINNECGINNINNIDINIGDEILKTNNKYAICKSEYVNELNNDLSKYGYPSNILAERFIVLSVFGTDNRVKVYPTTAIPYAGICYLTYMKGTRQGSGTGWLLNNSNVNQNSDYQLIITAGHCVTNYKSFAIRDLKIIPANNDTITPYGSIIPVKIGNNTIIFSNIKYINNIDEAWIKPQYDYGAILIKKSDNKSIYNFTIYENDLSPNTTFKSCTLAGYPARVKNVLVGGQMYKESGDVTVTASGTFCSYQIDTSKGDSGSPVWKFINNNSIRVIAIHNSTAAHKTNYGANAVLVKPYFDRWLAPQSSSSSLQTNGPTTNTFRLEKDKDWKLNTTYIFAPNNMVVIGVSLIEDGNNKNHIGLKLICTNLNGTEYKEVRTDDDPNATTYSIPHGHNRYFVIEMLNAPTDSTKGGLSRIHGGNLFYYKKDSSHYQIRFNLQVQYPNGDTQSIQSSTNARDGTTGKSEDTYMSNDEIVSDINYTAVTGLAFGVNGRLASINMITNVFWT